MAAANHSNLLAYMLLVGVVSMQLEQIVPDLVLYDLSRCLFSYMDLVRVGVSKQLL